MKNFPKIFTIASAILLFIIILSLGAYKKKHTANCFNIDNFEISKKYVEWRSKTSKVGKVLVNGYVVILNEQQEIIFQKKESTIFKATDNGLILLPIKQNSKLQNNAHETFCELVKSANHSGNNYK